MNTKDLKSLGGTIVMLGALTSLGVFARSATATQDLGEGRQQPAVEVSGVLGAVSPQDVPKTILVDDSPQTDPANPTEQPDPDTIIANPPEQTDPDPAQPPTPTEEEPDEESLRSIAFTTQAEQADSTVTVIAAATELLDGTCSYTFKKGNETLKFTGDSVGSSCSVTVSVNDFNSSGRWSVTHTYTANNRLSEGSSSAAVVITIPQTVLAFTGSSANIVDGSLSLSANLSAPASGTCSLEIESEQTVFTVMSDIVAADSCSALIPLAQLDGPGDFKATVSFSDGFDTVTTTLTFSI